jgi:hypothetical protein
MNDEDLDLYAKKLISTSTVTTDLLASTFTTTTPNDTSGYIVTSPLPTGIISSGGSVSVSPSYPAGFNNGISNVTTNWKLSHNGIPNTIDQTKEQQLEDVKDILNSVQRALEGLKTQVQVLSASIEDENELKHKRRKLGGDE